MNSRKFVLSASNKSINSVKRNLIEHLKSLDMSKDWEVVVKSHKEDKSAAQRAGFHLLLGVFSEETGYTLTELKDLCKHQSLGTVEREIMGRKFETLKSSEKAKKDEYSELIETCYRLAAEAGVILPILRR